MSEGYDWEDAASGSRNRAPLIPEGQTALEVKDIVFGGKNGKFSSKNNDPQIMLIFADGKGNESGQMFTLSNKAAWTLAGILAAAGADLRKMKERNIQPSQFADERFARAQLVGRKFTGDVAYESEGGKKYARITPLRTDSTAQAATAEDDLVPV